MSGQPETTTEKVCERTLAEQERQTRANAPTLRDLRKAAQELALAAPFANQVIGQPDTKQAEAYSASNVFAQ